MFSFNLKYLPHYTRADYEQWEGNWELIGGVPYSMISEPDVHYAMAPAPGWYHQKLSLNIGSEINSTLGPCPDCDVNMPVNWKIAENTIVQPDIVVVCKPFEQGLYLEKTPEIIFEILSPSTAIKDSTIKYEIYQAAGVKYYVIVKPIEKFAEIFRLNSENQYHSLGKFHSQIFHFEISGCSFYFDFGKIW